MPTIASNNNFTFNNIKVLERNIEDFLIAKKSEGRSSKTIQFYREKLNEFCKWFEENQSVTYSQLSSGSIRDFLNYLEEKGHNDGGRKAYYTSIRAFINFMWDEQDLDYPNPTRKIKVPKVEEKYLHSATIAEITKLLETCDKDTFTDTRDRALILCLFDSGMRRTEFLQLAIEDVEQISGSVVVHSKTKGKRVRKVHFGRPSRRLLRKYLAKRKDESPFLWVTEEGGQLSPNGLNEVLRRRSREAEITRISPHMLRRGSAKALNEIFTTTELRDYLGHKDIRTTAHYVQLENSELQSKAEENSPSSKLKIK
jgi:integrase/recombinase XerD